MATIARAARFARNRRAMHRPGAAFRFRRCARRTKLRSADATASRTSTTAFVEPQEPARRIPVNASAKRSRAFAWRIVPPVQCAPSSRASMRTIARASSAGAVGCFPSTVHHPAPIAGSRVLQSLRRVRSLRHLRLRRRAAIRAARSARAPRTPARSAANDHGRPTCAATMNLHARTAANEAARVLAGSHAMAARREPPAPASDASSRTESG